MANLVILGSGDGTFRFPATLAESVDAMTADVTGDGVADVIGRVDANPVTVNVADTYTTITTVLRADLRTAAAPALGSLG